MLRGALRSAASVLWSDDDWSASHETATADSGLGVHIAELPTQALPAGRRVVFTWREAGTGNWAGADYRVVVTEA